MRSFTGSSKPGTVPGVCVEDPRTKDGRAEDGGSAAGGSAGDGSAGDGSDEDDSKDDGSGRGACANTNVTKKKEAANNTATLAHWMCLRRDFNHPPLLIPAPRCMWDDAHALWLHGKRPLSPAEIVRESKAPRAHGK